jgi:hypothetical protein
MHGWNEMIAMRKLARIHALIFIAAMLSPAVAKGQSDQFCGPRCAKHVLEHFGQDAYLIDVIEDVQGGDLSDGASMAELAEYLEKRSLHTAIVSCSALDLPSWTGPAILHVNGDHFVVLEKCNGLSGVIWDGLSGTHEESWWELKSHWSGAMILISDQAIDGRPFTSPTLRRSALAIGLILIAAGGLGLAFKRRSDDRRQTRESKGLALTESGNEICR